MTENTTRESKGLLNSLSVLATTLVSIAHTRLELLSIDLEDDRDHLLSLVLISLSALFCLGIGVILTNILIVVFFWETHPLMALGGLAGLFLIIGFVSLRFAIHKAQTKPRFFAASLLELFKDKQQLDASNHNS
jgi:uncharacterized membrane protein YqjE